MWDFDHIGDLADELDAKAAIGGPDNHVIDKASDYENRLVTVFGAAEREL